MPDEMGGLAAPNDPLILPPYRPPGTDYARDALNDFVGGAGGALNWFAGIPQRIMEQSERSRLTGEYNPGPVMEAAQLAMPMGALAAERGALGAAGGRIIQPGTKMGDLAATAPPPEAGMTRFFHGGNVYSGGPRWLTTSQKYAQTGYTTPGATVPVESMPHLRYLQYVDLPEAHPGIPRQVGGGTINFQAPEDIARGLRPFYSVPQRQLAMDEASRMARAAEQGYTIDAYKGGFPYDWNTTPVTNARGEIIGNANVVPKELTEFKSSNTARPSYAGFFTSDPAVASHFAEVTSNQGAVFPTKLKFDNPLVIDGRGKPAAAFQFPSVAREHGMTDALEAYQSAFEKGSKYDGVIVKNTRDEGDVYVPRYSHQVRSKFAAFDPANAKSGHILGSLAAMPAVAAQYSGLFSPQDKMGGLDSQ